MANNKPRYPVIRPTTYTMSLEFTLKHPSDYDWVTSQLREAIEDTGRFVPMQTDGPFFKKKEEGGDG